MGIAAASAGTAGPSEGLRAGRSSGRTQAGVHRGEQTTRLRERADDRDAVPDYLLRPTMHGPGGTLLIIAHSFLERRSPKYRLATEARLNGIAATTSFFTSGVTLNQ